MKRLIWTLALLIAAGGATAQVEPPSPRARSAWPAYLGPVAEACGLRPDGWSEELQRGLLTDLFRTPAGWGAEMSRVMGVTYPSTNSVAQAQGALATAAELGRFLHARLPQASCAEARRAVPALDGIVRTADARNIVAAPHATALSGAPLAFTAALAADVCRIRSAEWGRHALSRITTQATAADGPAEQPARRQFLARISGALDMAQAAPALAHRVYGQALCADLRQWPELRQADIESEIMRREWDEFVRRPSGR